MDEMGVNELAYLLRASVQWKNVGNLLMTDIYAKSIDSVRDTLTPQECREARRRVREGQQP